MTDIEKVKDRQAERMLRFPENRIPFWGTDWSAKIDKQIFEAYADRHISLKTAVHRMRVNNFLEELTEEQFLYEFRACGYKRRGRYAKIQREDDTD